MKLVINRDYGGFGLSRKALDMYAAEKGIDPGKWNDTFKFYDNISDHVIQRDDPVLVRIVQELGNEANGGYAELKVVDIPDGVRYTIEEYDGIEWVAEVHRTWS
jgi:hypothetical protein